MTTKLISMVCNCINKVACACTDFWNAPLKNRKINISQRDLREWRRIEGIDQYNKKRY